MLLSHKVMSELYQEMLVTKDEMERMKGEGGDLLYQLISIQCTKPQAMTTKTADILDTFRHKEEATRLRGRLVK